MPSSLLEVGTHPEVVAVGQWPVAVRGLPERFKRLSLPKIGHLDPGFEESASVVDSPDGQQGADPLQDHSAVRRDAVRRGVDHREARG
jgi:hypothetical protein